MHSPAFLFAKGFLSYAGHGRNIIALTLSYKERNEMQFNVITQELGTDEILYDGSAEQPVDADITLPDYCPDIRRVLKCLITPRISGVQTAGDRATADGTAVVRVIYVGENGRISCFEQNYPFSKYVELKSSDENCCVNVRARTDYANCRAVSPRRLDVHGMISVSFRVSCRKRDEIITEAQGGGIQMQRQTVPAVSAVGSVERAFPMSEVIELPGDNPPVNCIIRAGAVALPSDIKVISNKLLVKGELIVNVLYCSDESDSTPVAVEHSMPISQIVELEGVDEDCICDVRLVVTSLDVIPKSDSSGENRLLDISARVCACASACREIELPVIVDTYSTSCELKTDQRSVDFCKHIDSFSETFLCRNTVDLSGSGVERILSMWCSDVVQSCAKRDSNMVISGTVMTHFIYIDKDSQPGYAERQIDFEYKRALKEDAERLKCDPEIQVCACSVSGTSDGKADVKIELKVCAEVYICDTRRIITSIEPVESSERQKKASTLTIYFADSGERLWNIARHYNTTVEAIQQENSITGESVNEKRMLLIPGV